MCLYFLLWLAPKLIPALALSRAGRARGPFPREVDRLRGRQMDRFRAQPRMYPALGPRGRTGRKGTFGPRTVFAAMFQHHK